jgi:hypothetical protein
MMLESAIKLILQDQYKSYQHGLALLGLDTLGSRREDLCLNFCQKCVKFKICFQSLKTAQHETREEEKYKVHAKTERLHNFLYYSHAKSTKSV